MLELVPAVRSDPGRRSNNEDSAFASRRLAAVRDGNDRIRFLVECRPQYAGMATTLSTVALGDDGTYVVANIGDSRVYLLRGRELRQLTRDDSLVQELIESGAVRPEDAPRHPHRNVVVQVLDGDPQRVPKLRTLRAEPGDRLLLCSDGISDVLDADALAGALAIDSREESAARLVDLALEAGSRDNVTAIVVDVVTGTAAGWTYAA